MFSGMRDSDFTQDPITVETETALVKAAQSGNKDALADLLAQYTPAILNQASQFARALGRDDAEQEAWLAATEAILAWPIPEEPKRIGGYLSSVVRYGLIEAASNRYQLTVSKSVSALTRRALAEAGGDLALALKNAEAERGPDHAATILAAAQAMQLADDFDGLTTTGAPTHAYDPYPEAEDALACEVAFAAMTEEGRAVTRLFYGFEPLVVEGAWLSGRECNDATVGASLGLSRSAAQRRRNKALEAAREALLAEPEADDKPAWRAGLRPAECGEAHAPVLVGARFADFDN